MTAPAAIFISYAREDSVAADRIAEALRSHGLEVWFDQNELRGGEAWDQKIRTQIRTCALLVPLVSANTQGRGEGYFRREWKLAAERTHDMAAGIPFLVPVVIDDTAEGSALVPDEFMRVQWTRLAQGRVTPPFVAQIKRLLETPRNAAATRPASPVVAPAEKVPSLAPVAGATPRKSPMLAIGAVAVLAIGAALFFALRPAAPPAANSKLQTPNSKPMDFAPAKSIAVLPFANLSTEKENEFFADGLHDDVITNLAKIRDLTVISRTSVLAYRDTASRNLKKIGAELGVATVLEGSVRRVGSKVHMNAQLIDARTDAHLWADAFDGDASDIFALQASLARQIAGALKATLTPGERALIERRPTGNQAAYDFYLRARALESGMNALSGLEKFKEVEALYEQSVDHDPGFALAYARLTWVHGVMYLMGHLDPAPERKARSQAALQQCERLAPAAPETHFARGAFAYFCANDWAKALAEFQAAEAGLPNDVQVLGNLAFTLRRLGRWSEALAMIERVMVISPNDLYFGTQSVNSFFFRGHFSEAVGLGDRLVKLFPNDNYIQETFVRARYQLDGDRAAYLRGRAALPALETDPHGLVAAYENAMLVPDLIAADRALADPRLGGVRSYLHVISEPTALHRAFVAFLRGDRAAAVRFADEALALLRAGRWTSRQEPFVTVAIARAETYADRSAEAVRHAQEALARIRSDGFDGMGVRSEVGRIYAALGRKDEALTLLRELLQTASDRSPREIRTDPLWSRLKDDPRFEEILKSAKPL